MTDAEINLAIAKIEYPNNELYPCEEHVDIRLGGGDYITVDYCNNWEDIGPIMEREKIDLTYLGYYKVWLAANQDDSNKEQAETPTKAAALCYLKMEAETPMKAAALCYLKMKGVE